IAHSVVSSRDQIFVRSLGDEYFELLDRLVNFVRGGQTGRFSDLQTNRLRSPGRNSFLQLRELGDGLIILFGPDQDLGDGQIALLDNLARNTGSLGQVLIGLQGVVPIFLGGIEA